MNASYHGGRVPLCSDSGRASVTAVTNVTV